MAKRTTKTRAKKAAPAKAPISKAPADAQVVGYAQVRGNAAPPMTSMPRPTVVPTQSRGSDGVYSYGGRLVSFERKPEMVGVNLFKTFDNMIANATIVGAAIRYFQNLIGGTAWSVTPRENTKSQATADKAAKIIEEGLFASPMTMPWSSIVKRASLYKYYGFSIHEWCVRRRPSDGMIVFKDIEHRPQHTIDLWDIPPAGGPFQGVVQLVPMRPEYFYVAREQMYYCVDNSLTDQPNGVGLMRHVVEHARRLQRFEQLEGWGYEGDLRGLAVGRVPGAELAKIAEEEGKGSQWFAEQTAAVHGFVRNHIKTPFQGIVLDSAPYISESASGAISAVPKWAIDVIKGASTGLADINTTIERVNREIARVLGMEFLLLGGDGKGSLALSRDKTSMFAAVMEATLGELAWYTLHDLCFPLLELNGIDPEEFAPQVNPDPIATERIEAVVASLVGLAQAGAPIAPDDPAINQVRSRLHIADAPKITPELAGVIPRGKKPGGPKAGRPGEQDAAGKPGTGNIAAETRTDSAIAGAEDGKSKVEAQIAGKSARPLFRVDDAELDPSTRKP